MRRAIYGGSFNPIHNDHIKLALQFAEQFELDKVTLIPTHYTPLKDNSHIADGKHRYQMCLLATEDEPLLEVSDIELRREGPSYTSDTIAQLMNDEDSLYLIVGADMYMTLDKWHDFNYIFDNVTILAAPRDELDRRLLARDRPFEIRFEIRVSARRVGGAAEQRDDEGEGGKGGEGSFHRETDWA